MLVFITMFKNNNSVIENWIYLLHLISNTIHITICKLQKVMKFLKLCNVFQSYINTVNILRICATQAMTRSSAVGQISLMRKVNWIITSLVLEERWETTVCSSSNESTQM